MNLGAGRAIWRPFFLPASRASLSLAAIPGPVYRLATSARPTAPQWKRRLEIAGCGAQQFRNRFWENRAGSDEQTFRALALLREESHSAFGFCDKLCRSRGKRHTGWFMPCGARGERGAAISWGQITFTIPGASNAQRWCIPVSILKPASGRGLDERIATGRGPCLRSGLRFTLRGMLPLTASGRAAADGQPRRASSKGCSGA